jgi:hypothetical protein
MVWVGRGGGWGGGSEEWGCYSKNRDVGASITSKSVVYSPQKQVAEVWDQQPSKPPLLAGDGLSDLRLFSLLSCHCHAPPRAAV